VHNAQAGLFCIAAQNREASCSLAGRSDTFACGWLEVLTHLEREPDARVLYVMADVELAPRFAALVEEPEASYALALLVARDGDGPQLRFDLAGSDPTPVTPWPHAGRVPALDALRRGAPLDRALPLDALLGRPAAGRTFGQSRSVCGSENLRQRTSSARRNLTFSPRKLAKEFAFVLIALVASRLRRTALARPLSLITTGRVERRTRRTTPTGSFPSSTTDTARDDFATSESLSAS
jgi:hypothetical protein